MVAMQGFSTVVKMSSMHTPSFNLLQCVLLACLANKDLKPVAKKKRLDHETMAILRATMKVVK